MQMHYNLLGYLVSKKSYNTLYMPFLYQPLAQKFDIYTQTTNVALFSTSVIPYSLVNQTLWSQGAYQLEIISARSERVW